MGIFIIPGKYSIVPLLRVLYKYGSDVDSDILIVMN